MVYRNAAFVDQRASLQHDGLVVDGRALGPRRDPVTAGAGRVATTWRNLDPAAAHIRQAGVDLVLDTVWVQGTWSIL